MSGRELSGADKELEPGAVLAAAREELGITQREVSDALNLPIATIDAIETNDQTHLPAQVFTRGYVRAYAKLLEIDAEPLVAAMGGEGGAEDASKLIGADGGPVGPNEKQNVPHSLCPLLVIPLHDPGIVHFFLECL